MDELRDELYKDLLIELADEIHDSSDEKHLSLKIKNAIRDVKQHRNYQKHHDSQFIDEDMQQYYSVIYNLVIYDWNVIGAEGETSHSENGISRAYVAREKYFDAVIPFATVC